MYSIVTGILAFTLAAAACGVLWMIFRPISPEKRWHVFFTCIRINGTCVPLYVVGDYVGTRSFPNLSIAKEGEWKIVTVKGYASREEGHAAATKHGEIHHDEVSAIQKTLQRPGEYTPTPRSLDPDLTS